MKYYSHSLNNSEGQDRTGRGEVNVNMTSIYQSINQSASESVYTVYACFTLSKHIPSASLLPCFLWHLVHLTALSAPLHTYQVESGQVMLHNVMSFHSFVFSL